MKRFRAVLIGLGVVGGVVVMVFVGRQVLNSEIPAQPAGEHLAQPAESRPTPQDEPPALPPTEQLTRQETAKAKPTPDSGATLQSPSAQPQKSSSERAMEEEKLAERPTTPDPTTPPARKTVRRRFGDREVEIEIGKRYLILRRKVNPNPRPFTPEESRRHAELLRRRLKLINDPNADPEEIQRLSREIEAMGPGLAYAAEWGQPVWIPAPGQTEPPPESETIVIDLR